MQDMKIFAAWQKILYNKRMFRAKDKVCERHFEKDQILTHWDHKIGGNIVQLQRDKPKLKPDAIPTLNLPEMCVPPSDSDDDQPSANIVMKTNETSAELTARIANICHQSESNNTDVFEVNQKRVTV